jgi:hypothetical protein
MLILKKIIAKLFSLQLTILFFLLSISCKDNNKIVEIESPLKSNSSLAQINASGGLRLRNNPKLKSKSLGIIPNGSQIKILKKKGPLITIAKRKGKWLKIDWNGQIGWVFGGFVIYNDKVNETGLEIIPKNIIGIYEFDTNSCKKCKLRDLNISKNIISINYKDSIEIEAFCLAADLKIINDSKIVVYCDKDNIPKNKEEGQNYQAAIQIDVLIVEKKDEFIIISGSNTELDGKFTNN